jgi:hypothetical protein
MFHEFDDDFKRIERLQGSGREKMNRANILPARYIREGLGSISPSHPAQEGKYVDFSAK